MMHAVDILVQPFGVQNSMPPVENKILNNEVEYYLAENYFPTLMKPKTKLNLDKLMIWSKLRKKWKWTKPS